MMMEGVENYRSDTYVSIDKRVTINVDLGGCIVTALSIDE